MDNTEKKIDALIDYLGLEVVEIETPNNNLGIVNELNPAHIDYKLTKKEENPFPWMDTNSPVWSAIVTYVLDHQAEIEFGVSDFETLKPVLEFFNRNCDGKKVTLQTKGHEFEESILQ